LTAEFSHASVLLSESIAALQPRSGGRYIDATVGGGGHAEKILELSAPDGKLLGLDADPAALTATRRRLAPYGQRVVLVETYFDHLAEAARRTGFEGADGILFDLGVSSPQLDRPERGFSFAADDPLDMRLGPSAERSAEALVNGLPAAELERIIRDFGEERYARRVAERIVRERTSSPIRTTGQLAEIVKRAKPRSNERIHPATRVFQALRIAVNDELDRLQRALPQALEALGQGGRLAVISFHSLEDRIVKVFFREEARGCVCPPELPACVCGRQPSLRIVTRKPVTATAGEVDSNPRARSAKLRVAEKM
jgi:16S rRNA (cytosine1402-N4)-methyltransferase